MNSLRIQSKRRATRTRLPTMLPRQGARRRGPTPLEHSTSLLVATPPPLPGSRPPLGRLEPPSPLPPVTQRATRSKIRKRLHTAHPSPLPATACSSPVFPPLALEVIRPRSPTTPLLVPLLPLLGPAVVLPD